MLSWYMERFDTVELNNSFYHLPPRETFEAWRRATPASFCFAVKGSRYITHRKKLNDPAPALARFMEPVESLGDKLGPILFQLPPRWTCNVPRLDGFPGRAAAESPIYVRISRSELARSRRSIGHWDGTMSPSACTSSTASRRPTSSRPISCMSGFTGRAANIREIILHSSCVPGLAELPGGGKESRPSMCISTTIRRDMRRRMRPSLNQR